MKPLIGMKGGYSLTDTLIYKLSGVGPFTGSGDTTSTRMTSSLSKLNTGEVTSYPYGIDSSISVAPTHAQYFALNLETQVNGSDPVVWYTLDNGDKNYFHYQVRMLLIIIIYILLVMLHILVQVILIWIKKALMQRWSFC